MTRWKKEEIFPSSRIISKVKGKILGIARNNFTAFNAFLPQLHSPCLIRHNVLKIKRIIVGERRDFLALKSFYYFSYIYVKLLYIRHNAEGCYSMSWVCVCIYRHIGAKNETLTLLLMLLHHILRVYGSIFLLFLLLKRKQFVSLWEFFSCRWIILISWNFFMYPFFRVKRERPWSMKNGFIYGIMKMDLKSDTWMDKRECNRIHIVCKRDVPRKLRCFMEVMYINVEILGKRLSRREFFVILTVFYSNLNTGQKYS